MVDCIFVSKCTWKKPIHAKYKTLSRALDYRHMI
jgi:hypothetical protein